MEKELELRNKRAVITGASQGLGLSIAAMFSAQGADVLISGRHSDSLAAATACIERTAVGKVRSLCGDVSNPDDVRQLAATAEADFGGADILVCNAGVYGPKGPIERIDWDEWVTAININLMGTVLCCREFIPQLERAHPGKIILLSGGGATKPLAYLSAYAASKAAVVRFGETLSEELAGRGIDVNMVAPGALNTRLLDEVLAAGPENVGSSFYEASLRQKEKGGTPLERGAELCVYLASRESDGITGKLISAVWDPWKDFTQYREELRGSDIYTLRRIVPGERGKTWG